MSDKGGSVKKEKKKKKGKHSSPSTPRRKGSSKDVKEAKESKKGSGTSSKDTKRHRSVPTSTDGSSSSSSEEIEHAAVESAAAASPRPRSQSNSVVASPRSKGRSSTLQGEEVDRTQSSSPRDARQLREATEAAQVLSPLIKSLRVARAPGSGAAAPDASDSDALLSALEHPMRVLHDFCVRDLVDGPEVEELLASMESNELVRLLVTRLPRMTFDLRRDTMELLSALLQRRDGKGNYPLAKYMSEHPEVLNFLFVTSGEHESTAYCSELLRQCMRRSRLARLMLEPPVLKKMMTEYVRTPEFGAAIEHWQTFETLLTTHVSLSAEYLLQHFDSFFEDYVALLQDEGNFLLRRNSLELLPKLLDVDPAVCAKFVSRAEHLKITMMALSDESSSIKTGAIVIFDRFVRAGKQNEEVALILQKNRERLIEFFLQISSLGTAELDSIKDNILHFLAALESDS